jgi:hypothetical protein
MQHADAKPAHIDNQGRIYIPECIREHWPTDRMLVTLDTLADIWHVHCFATDPKLSNFDPLVQKYGKVYHVAITPKNLVSLRDIYHERMEPPFMWEALTDWTSEDQHYKELRLWQESDIYSVLETADRTGMAKLLRRWVNGGKPQ